MNKIFAYFQQSFPIIQKPWLAIIIPSSIVMLITTLSYLFQLYGLKSGEVGFTIFRIAGFTLITFLPIFIALYILAPLFKTIYSSESWTMGKYILTCLILLGIISFGNFLFYNSITRNPLGIFYRSFKFWAIVTFLVGLIPISIITFISQNSELIYNLKYAKELNKRLKALNTADKMVATEKRLPCDRKIILSGDTKDAVELIPENIIYIEASGNYVLVNYKENQEVHRSQLRATLSKMESDLQQYSTIIRCHRAFLVNSTYVTEIKGNSQGLQLNFEDSKENIPVSRTYLKTITESIIKNES